MINFTLTITAAPELLAAMTSFIRAITSAKVAANPDYNSEFTAHKALKEQTTAAVSYVKPAPQITACQMQNPSSEQTMAAQKMPQIQSQAPIHTTLVQEASEPTSAQSYIMEQLAVAATQIVDEGRRTEFANLLASFNVQALTALPKEQYEAFATQLRVLGAKI